MKNNEEANELKSKSQLKREMHALQELGEQLVELPTPQLEKVPLDERLKQAILLARQITSHEGKRRQLQYIGRLMRSLDVTLIKEFLDALSQQSSQSKAHFHRLEKWRDRLLGEGDKALTDFLSAHPSADRQHLRQLVRNAQQEQQQNQPPQAARRLFRYLREVLEQLERGANHE